MLTCFPDPYPDEIFYSICARYVERMRYSTRAAAMKDLFNSQVGKATIALPCHLAALVDNLPPKYYYSVERFINEHTLFPLFRPFLSLDRAFRLKESMKGRKGSDVYGLIGAMNYSIPLPKAEIFRFCSICVNEDRHCWGECYWHRIHQAPGVEVCPAHRCVLHKINRTALRGVSGAYFISAEQIVDLSTSTTIE